MAKVLKVTVGHTRAELNTVKETIDSSLTTWADIIVDRWAEGDYRDQRLKIMAQQFSDTAKEFIDFFSNLQVGSDEKLQQLQLLAIDSIEGELAVVSLPLIQRLAGIAKGAGGEYSSRLREADEWANYFYNAYASQIAKVKSSSAGANVSPIVYFDVSASIRRFFFTDYPLIAVRYRSFAQDMVWESIAHEMGHFVFHNTDQIAMEEEILELLRDRITEMLLTERSTLLTGVDSYGSYEIFLAFDTVVERWVAWLEEVFADICGALFAGPAYADSTRELVHLRSGEEIYALTEDDDVHPPLYLRPIIVLDTLDYVVNTLRKYEETPQLKFIRDFIENRREKWSKELLAPVQVAAKNGEIAAGELQIQLLERSIPLIVGSILTLQKTDTQTKDASLYSAEIPKLITLIDVASMLKLVDADSNVDDIVGLPSSPTDSTGLPTRNRLNPTDRLPQKFSIILHELEQNRKLTKPEDIAFVLLQLAQSRTDLLIGTLYGQLYEFRANSAGRYIIIGYDNNGPVLAVGNGARKFDLIGSV